MGTSDTLCRRRLIDTWYTRRTSRDRPLFPTAIDGGTRLTGKPIPGIIALALSPLHGVLLETKCRAFCLVPELSSCALCSLKNLGIQHNNACQFRVCSLQLFLCL